MAVRPEDRTRLRRRLARYLGVIGHPPPFTAAEVKMAEQYFDRSIQLMSAFIASLPDADRAMYMELITNRVLARAARIGDVRGTEERERQGETVMEPIQDP